MLIDIRRNGIPQAIQGLSPSELAGTEYLDFKIDEIYWDVENPVVSSSDGINYVVTLKTKDGYKLPSEKSSRIIKETIYLQRVRVIGWRLGGDIVNAAGTEFVPYDVVYKIEKGIDDGKYGVIDNVPDKSLKHSLDENL